jgi:hypothetical protein
MDLSIGADSLLAQTALSLGVGVGLAAAAGLRVFVPLLVLGAAAHAGWIPLTPSFAWLASPSSLAILSVATIVEIAAYYVPWVDNLLDVIAGPLAVLAGVVATAAVMTDLPPALRWSAAIIAGGGTAAAVQGLTSLTRLKSSALTGGLANPVLATVELAGSIATSFIVIIVPLVALIVVLAIVWIAWRIGRRRSRRV